MIVGYLVFPSFEAAETRQAELAAACGYPDEATKTDRLVNTLTHQDGRAALPIDDNVYCLTEGRHIDMRVMLTAEEVAALKTYAEMDADGWFPPMEW